MCTCVPPSDPWATRFIELALRALRRTHYEYSVWLSGSGANERLASLNMGPGVELADERAVCAAITQELVARRTSGRKTWLIDREAAYSHRPSSNGSQKVDIAVRRISRRSNRYATAFIEAKRAALWAVDIHSGSANCTSIQKARVAADIDKLVREKAYRRRKRQSILIHILVRGTFSEIQPLPFFRTVCPLVNSKGTLCVHQMRSFPLSWEVPLQSDLLREITPPPLTRALWIALAEIRPILGRSSARRSPPTSARGLNVGMALGKRSRKPARKRRN